MEKIAALPWPACSTTTLHFRNLPCKYLSETVTR